MSHSAAAPGRPRPVRMLACYQRYLAEQKLLYQIIEQHYPQLVARMAGEGWLLPNYVRREFEKYLLHSYPTMAEALKIIAISRCKDPAKLYCCAE